MRATSRHGERDPRSQPQELSKNKTAARLPARPLLSSREPELLDYWTATSSMKKLVWSDTSSVPVTEKVIVWPR